MTLERYLEAQRAHEQAIATSHRTGAAPAALPASTIDLYTDSAALCWVARFGGRLGDDMRALVGRVDFPLPFTTAAPFAEVQAQVKPCYPDAAVFCRHRNTGSTPGVGVVVCADCGTRW